VLVKLATVGARTGEGTDSALEDWMAADTLLAWAACAGVRVAADIAMADE
jgi:hypothetical protein